MRRFILIIIHTFFILGPIFAQRSSTDNIIDSVNNATYKKFDEIERMMSGVQEKMKATLRALKLDKM